MPDLSAVETATVSADDFTVKSLIAVSSAQFLAPCHFFLHRFKFLRGDYGFVRIFHVILGHFAVIDPQFFRQEVSCKAFLAETGGFEPTWDCSQTDFESAPL